MESPRIDAAVEPYPNRWTHHVPVQGIEEIDEELMGWVKRSCCLCCRQVAPIGVSGSEAVF